MKVYLIRSFDKRILCVAGTDKPIDFGTKEQAQKYLDNNEHPENDYEIAEADSLETVREYLKTFEVPRDRSGKGGDKRE